MPHTASSARGGLSRRGFLAATSAAGLGATALTACSSDSGGKDSSGRTVIEWWNITTGEPGKGIWAARAKEFEAKNPNVRIKPVVLENDAYKAKMTALISSGKLPDIFHTWGGGVLGQQVQAGLVEDLTESAADVTGGMMAAAKKPYEIDGKTYGVPFDIGAVGFWYNKKLFAQAGITAPPTTWADYLDAVKALKDAGITPIALAGKEKWPGMYYWSYLAMRVAGLDAMRQAAEAKDFTGDDFVKAGEHLKELVDLEPFQKGFLGAAYSTPTGQAAAVGNAKAAMELMGQWAPSVEADQGKGLGADLGFFQFPSVDGGKGALTEVFGGGGGHAIRKGAPKEALEFVKFFSEAEFHRKLVKETGLIPVVTAAADALSDPNLKLVSDALNGSTGFQLYLDQDYPPAVGQEVNDSVAALIAGSKSPGDVTKSITQVFKSQ
ncbi:extracellular solute-binding protein [Streptomyces sp. NPDC051940]|uniref:extracellular solute-binding protein n=1 Tax=Streptomyces sp. NPDC051940 TaxID=3155675 RepID=UPI003445DCEB